MARGGPGVTVRVREFVDRSARHSPARLALGVFALVIAIFTVLLSDAVVHVERAPRPVRRRAVHGDLGEHRHGPRRRADRALLVDLRAWS